MKALWAGQIKVKPVYKCSGCGKERLGSGSFTRPVESIDDIERVVKLAPTGLMPIGWASYGYPVIKCEGCQT